MLTRQTGWSEKEGRYTSFTHLWFAHSPKIIEVCELGIFTNESKFYISSSEPNFLCFAMISHLLLGRLSGISHFRWLPLVFLAVEEHYHICILLNGCLILSKSESWGAYRRLEFLLLGTELGKGQKPALLIAFAIFFNAREILGNFPASIPPFTPIFGISGHECRNRLQFSWIFMLLLEFSTF